MAEAFCAIIRDIFEIIDSAVKSFFCTCNDREEIITFLKFGAYVIRHGSYIIDVIMVGQTPPCEFVIQIPVSSIENRVSSFVSRRFFWNLLENWQKI